MSEDENLKIQSDPADGISSPTESKSEVIESGSKSKERYATRQWVDTTGKIHIYYKDTQTVTDEQLQATKDYETSLKEEFGDAAEDYQPDIKFVPKENESVTENVTGPDSKRTDRIYRELLSGVGSKILSDDLSLVKKYDAAVKRLEEGEPVEDFVEIQGELESVVNEAQEVFDLDIIRLHVKAQGFAIIDDPEQRDFEVRKYIDSI